MKGGGGNSLGIKLRDTLEFVKTIPPWRKRERERKRETRHYKNAKNENEKPSIKKKKKEREEDVKYKIVYISGTADERMMT